MLRCAASFVIAAYHKYASFLKDLCALPAAFLQSRPTDFLRVHHSSLKVKKTDMNFALARTIKFTEENSLPGSKNEPVIFNVHNQGYPY